MTLMRKHMRWVALKRPIASVTEEGYQEEAKSFQAVIQPLSGGTAAQMYGEKLSRTKLLLTRDDIKLEEGFGLCVDVPATKHPDYRVVCVAGWAGHQNVHIQQIPKSEREDADA